MMIPRHITNAAGVTSGIVLMIPELSTIIIDYIWRPPQPLPIALSLRYVYSSCPSLSDTQLLICLAL
jgi:hypothetical protein